MNSSLRILAGLVAGVVLGVLTAATDAPALTWLMRVAEPVGTLWLNGLRMTIVPLVVALLVTGVASAREAAATGRVAGRTLLVIVLFLLAAGLFGAMVMPVVLSLMPRDPDTTAAFREALTGDAPPAAVPPFSEWITGLVPSNVLAAAAEGAMLPLIVFAMLLGVAASRLADEPRRLLLGLFAAIRDAMMIIVGWVLVVAPLGVFALVMPLAARAGLGVVGALAQYVVLISAACIAVTLLLYPIAARFGGIPIGRFARAVAHPQAVAFGTRSSLATLPAMLETAEGPLKVPPAVGGVVLPLAVSLMRYTTPVKDLGAALFAAWVVGVDVSAANVAAGAVVVVLTSLGGVGLPGQAVLVAQFTPVFLAVGAPLELLGPLLAVEVIPDAFGTVGNVTADLAATAVVAHEPQGAPSASFPGREPGAPPASD
jgi:Na+/H+-dicarboxylate symporter